MVYSSDNYQNDWDGHNMDGEELASDTYWYIFFIEGISNEFKGYIYLKR
jgi:hypothetical protein